MILTDQNGRRAANSSHTTLIKSMCNNGGNIKGFSAFSLVRRSDLPFVHLRGFILVFVVILGGAFFFPAYFELEGTSCL